MASGARWTITNADRSWLALWLVVVAVVVVVSLLPGASPLAVLLGMGVTITAFAAAGLVISRRAGRVWPGPAFEHRPRYWRVACCAVFIAWWVPFYLVMGLEGSNTAPWLAACLVWMGAGWQVSDLVARGLVGVPRSDMQGVGHDGADA